MEETPFLNHPLYITLKYYDAFQKRKFLKYRKLVTLPMTLNAELELELRYRV